MVNSTIANQLKNTELGKKLLSFRVEAVTGYQHSENKVPLSISLKQSPEKTSSGNKSPGR